MKFSTIFFNRKSQTAQQLEQEFKDLLSTGPFALLSVAETEVAGKVMFSVLQDATLQVKQEISIFSIEQVHDVAAKLDEYVGSLGKNVKVKAINLLPQGGLRAIGLVLTEEPAEVKSDGTRKTPAPRRPAKQNPPANAGTNSGSEGSSVD
jgi:hypothetical protein